MTENAFASHTEPQAEPTLRRNLELPKGVLQKNLKTFVYLGAALLVIVAALFSSSGKKTPAQQASAKGQPPQPTLQDNTDNNVQELKNQLQAERQKEQQATMATAAFHAQTTFSDTEAEIGEAVDLVVHVERQPGRRILREVLALRGYDRDAKRFLIEPVFEAKRGEPTPAAHRKIA